MEAKPREGLAGQTTTPKPRQNAPEELRRLLGPLVPALLRDGEGALDLKKIPTDSFTNFRDFLITQVKTDGIAFNQYLLASYHKILAKEEYQPLLQELFNSTRPSGPTAGLKPLATGNLLQQFTAEIISVSAQKYVSNNILNASGRQRIRSILSDKITFTKGLRADVAKAVAQSGYEMGASTSTFLEFKRQITLINYANIGISEEEMSRAAELAQQMLKQVERFEKDGVRFQNRYLFDPAAVKRFAGLERQLDRKITDEEIQEKDKLGKQGDKAIDPIAQLKGKLARFWLLVVDEDKWKASNPYKLSIHAAFLFKETERLLKQGEGVQKEEDFIKWNESVRDFLQGGLEISGEGWRKDVGDFFSVGTVAAMLSPIPQAHRAPYDELKQFVEEIHHSVDMGEPIVLKNKAGDDNLADIREQFLQGLQQTKRSLWLGYKQHRLLSRGASYIGSRFGVGDIVEIKSGQKALDQLITKVEAAKDVGQIQAAIQELQGQLKEDGQIQLALRAAEMEGTEQILGLAQTIAILLTSRGLLKIAETITPTLLPISQVAAYDTLGWRAGKAFGIGFYLPVAENLIAAGSGEVRPDGEHLANWFKDSTATAVSMMLLAPLGSFLGKQSSTASLSARFFTRYFRSGVHGISHFATDTALETMEEWIDASLRTKMDDIHAVVGKDQAREIAMVITAGGGLGTAKMGILSELLKGTPTPTQKSPQSHTPSVEQTPIAPRARIDQLRIESKKEPVQEPAKGPDPDQTPLATAVEQSSTPQPQAEATPVEVEPEAEPEVEAEVEPEAEPEAELEVEAEVQPEAEPELEPEEAEEESRPSGRPTLSFLSSPQSSGPLVTELDSEPAVSTLPPSELETRPAEQADSESFVEPDLESEPLSDPDAVVEATPEPDAPMPEASDPVYEAELLENIQKLEAQLAKEQGESAAALRLANEAHQEAIERGARAVQEAIKTLSQEKNTRIAQLEQDNSTLAAERDAQVALRQEEEGKLARSETTVTNLTARETELLGELEGERARLALAQQHIQMEQAARQGHEQLKNQNADLENNLELRNVEMGQLKDERTQLTTIHEEDAAKRKLDEARIAELESLVKSLEKELQRRMDLGTAHAELRNALEFYRVELGQLKDEKVHFKTLLEEETRKRQTHEAHIKELGSQVAGLKKELQGVKDELERAQRRYGAASVNLIHENERVGHLQGDIQNLQNTIRQAQEQAKAKDERIKVLMGEISELHEIEEVSSFAEDEETIQLKENLKTLKRERDQLLLEASKNERRLAHQDRQLDNALDRQKFSINRVEKLRSLYLIKSEQYHELKGNYGKLEVEVTGLRKVDDRLGVAKDELLGQVQDNVDLRKEIISDKNESNATIMRLRKSLKENRVRILDLEKKSRDSERSATKAEQEKATMEVELKTAKEKLEEFRSSQLSNKHQVDSFIRHEKFLVAQIQTLNLLVHRAQDRAQTAREHAAQFRHDFHTVTAYAKNLDVKLSQLTEAKATIRTLQVQDARQQRELNRLEREAQGKRAAQADAVRQRDLLKGRTRELDHARNGQENLLRQIRAYQEALKQQGLVFAAQTNVLEGQAAVLIEQMETLTHERDAAKAQVEQVREVETRLANRVQELTEAQSNADPLPPPSLPKRDSNAPPPMTLRIPHLAESIPDERRRATPPFNPSPEEVQHNLTVTLADLKRARDDLRLANQKVQATEDALMVKEHELNNTIVHLKTILGSRGPALFNRTDPRLAKVEPAIQSRLTLTDKQGEIIGRAEIIAGGKEGFILPVITKGSIISAKTSKGVPKGHQTGNQDGIYYSQFTVILDKNTPEKKPVEVTILAGADGAGGEKRGDLATVFLQGVHAKAAELAYEGRVPEPKELFEAGRQAVDAQHDFHKIPRDPRHQVTGAGAVVVIIGNQAMIATAGDAPVIFTRKMPDGSYQSEGYSNFDVLPNRNTITNGIHLKIVVDTDEDGALEQKLADPPRLYAVKNIGAGSYFTLGSDGLINQMDTIFTDGANFTGSKEWQNNAKSQRGFLLRNNFHLFDLLLHSWEGKEDIADQLHDMALGNMRNPGQKIHLKGLSEFFPARPSPDNIFAISYRHGEKTQNLFRIPTEYQALERIYETPPPPLLKYLRASEENVTHLVQQYTAPLMLLYGIKTGQEVAKTLANLYRNFPEVEAKFNPNLLAKAPDYKITTDLFDYLQSFLLNHPEVKVGDNKPFMDGVTRDLRAIKEAAFPFTESTRAEAQIILQKYHAGLAVLFPGEPEVAARYFSNIYKNFPELESEFNPGTLKVMDKESLRRKLILLSAKFSSDGVKPTERHRFEGVQKALNSLLDLWTRLSQPASSFVTFEPAPSSEASPYDQAPRSSYSPHANTPDTSERFYHGSSTYDKGKDRYFFGRLDAPDPFLSAEHMEIIHNGDLWLVRDLGSQYGTWLDGEAIHESKENTQTVRAEAGFHQIQNGSELQVGSTYLKAIVDERLEKLTFKIIHRQDYHFAPQGPALKPQFMNKVLRMNRATSLDLIMGKSDLGIYPTETSPDLFKLVLGKIPKWNLIASETTLGNIMRIRDTFWLRNTFGEDILIRRGEGEGLEELPLKHQQQAPLQWGDWIKLGDHEIQFFPG